MTIRITSVQLSHLSTYPLLGMLAMGTGCFAGDESTASTKTDASDSFTVVDEDPGYEGVPTHIPTHIRGGNEVSGFPGIVQIAGCTGSMIGPTLILTSAHCYSQLAAGSSTLVLNQTIKYFEPGLPANDPRLILSGTVRVHIHPDYVGYSWGDFYDWRGANHDIAIVETTDGSRWPGTTYKDYLRLYQDNGNDLPDYLRLYGRGYETLTGNGLGTLREALFEVQWVGSYRVELHDTSTIGACKGDSGGPYLVPGQLNLIACVESRGDLDGDYCAQDDGVFDQSTEACARTNKSNVVDLIEGKTSVSCLKITDNGTYNYSRCFDVPYINNVAGEGLEQGLATGIVMALL